MRLEKITQRNKQEKQKEEGLEINPSGTPTFNGPAKEKTLKKKLEKQLKILETLMVSLSLSRREWSPEFSVAEKKIGQG